MFCSLRARAIERNNLTVRCGCDTSVFSQHHETTSRVQFAAVVFFFKKFFFSWTIFMLSDSYIQKSTLTNNKDYQTPYVVLQTSLQSTKSLDTTTFCFVIPVMCSCCCNDWTTRSPPGASSTVSAAANRGTQVTQARDATDGSRGGLSSSAGPCDYSCAHATYQHMLAPRHRRNSLCTFCTCGGKRACG